MPNSKSSGRPRRAHRRQPKNLLHYNIEDNIIIE